MDKEENASTSKSSDKNEVVKKTGKKVTDKLTTTFIRYVIPRPMKLWSKFANNRKQRRISKKIDEDLKKDNHVFYETLFIGDKGSGKTTIFKQMKILYANGYSDLEKRKFIKVIERNIKDGILTVVTSVVNLDKPLDVDPSVKDQICIIEKYNFKSDNQQFYSCAETLWKDPCFQEALKHIKETSILAAAKYFINKIDLLKCKDFLPTNEDVLRCYEPTKAAVELKFNSDVLYHKMFGIPNLKYEKRLWKQIVKGISTIVFVIPCNSFVELKNKKEIPLAIAIGELEKFLENAWGIEHLNYIVFLNKVDLFAEIILKGNVDLHTCFPGFSEYEKFFSVEDGVTKAKEYISNTFMTELPDFKKPWNAWYIHFTCAIDSENMSDVYRECENVIKISNLTTLPLY